MSRPALFPLVVALLTALPAPAPGQPSAPLQAARIARLAGATAVGGVTDGSARFRVRLDGPGSVAIEASTSTGFSDAIRGSAGSAEASRDFVALVGLSGLEPDTRYYYRPVIDGEPADEVRSFRTFPAPDASPTFTFAFGSCQQNAGTMATDPDPGRVFRRVAESDARFFLQIGDWGYPDSTDHLPDTPDFFSLDYGRVQQTYHTKFNRDYPMDLVLATMPVDYVYDDHDFVNDNASAATTAFTIPVKPNEYGSTYYIRDLSVPPEARENSIRAYQENMPSYPLPNPSRGIYHSFRFGDAEFFMLDLRSQRSPNLEGFILNQATGKWGDTPPRGHSILGRAGAPGTGPSQLSWLLEGLRSSTATWKFLACSVPFNKGQVFALQVSLLLQDTLISDPRLPSGVRGIAAAFELADKWAGFPEDIDTLLSFIRTNRIRNVIVLSGDSHNAAMDDGANAGLPEIMAGGLDITNSHTASLLASVGLRIWNRGGQGFTTSVFNDAYGRVTVFGTDSVRLALVDEEGVEFASYTRRDEATGLRSAGPDLPERASLEQNYPNPFNPTTTITFELPRAGAVRLAVFDLLGREVARLADGPRQAGRQSVVFDARGLAGGVYVCRLTAGEATVSRRMVLLR